MNTKHAKKRQYNHNFSSTYVSLNDNKTFSESLYYATDMFLVPINGYFSQDIIRLAPFSSSASNFTFVEALEINGKQSSTVIYDVWQI